MIYQQYWVVSLLNSDQKQSEILNIHIHYGYIILASLLKVQLQVRLVNHPRVCTSQTVDYCHISLDICSRAWSARGLLLAIWIFYLFYRAKIEIVSAFEFIRWVYLSFLILYPHIVLSIYVPISILLLCWWCSNGESWLRFNCSLALGWAAARRFQERHETNKTEKAGQLK